MTGRRALPAALIILVLTTLGSGLRLASADQAASPHQAPPSSPVIRLVYRTLQPGEPLVVYLDTDGSVRSASVTFLGKTAVLRPAPDGQSGFGFLGIDLLAKSGVHTMVMKVRRDGTAAEEIQRTLEVQGRTFPFAKLQLDRDYVTPPAAARERIRREAELVALATSEATPRWLGVGPFVPPHDAPSWANFGQRRLNNDILQSVHAGLDIRAPFGAPIRAANSGRVVLASDLYLGGKTVIIDHGLGVYSSYGHMSKLLVKRGEAVKKGATVGLCGSTGRSTGPHLHWSVKILEARVDPEAMLALPLR